MAKPITSSSDLDKMFDEQGDIKDPIPPAPKAPKKVRTEYIFQQTVNFRVEPDSKTIRYAPLSLSNSQMVYDEETKKLRQARLIRGFGSMWQDDQKDLDVNYVKRNPVTLVFTDGLLRIPTIDVNTVKYLMLCSDFEGCEKPAQNRKTRYRLLDTEAKEAAEFIRKKRQKDAVDIAWKSSMENLLVHYQYLGGTLLNDQAQAKTEDGLRSDYVKKAEDQYELFLKTVSNPIVKMHMLVKRAFEKAFIIYVDGQCLWADTKVYICQVPTSYQSNVAGYLAELMLTPEGKEVRARLETL